jgi:plastocyanin
MKQSANRTLKTAFSFARIAIVTAGAAATVQGTQWQSIAGAESPDRGSEALAFMPNEFWVHPGDSIRWVFPTHERHTLTFLTPGQTRPAAFGPTFGVVIGCPGVTPDGSSFDGSSCVTSDVLMLPEDDTQPPAPAPTYTVSFPSTGNFKFVCLVHNDMTGVVHVVDLSTPLPYDQSFYNQEAQGEQAYLLSEAADLQRRRIPSGPQSNSTAAGVGQIVTITGTGSQTASLMRFVPDTIVVRVGDTVEWANLDPSINHTVTFGTEPADPRPVSSNVTVTSDGARQATISSVTQSVNSGFLTATPQDRPNLAQASPNITRFRVTFTVPGVFNYICAVHDQLGMEGRVLVHP